MTMAPSTATPLTGRAAGVPFVTLPPAGGRRADAPVVVAWHLLDSPRTETALAAALPLHDLDAWRIYLGLPLSGVRLPAGGWDALLQLGYEDVVVKLDQPIVYGAVAELGAAFDELRQRLGLGDGPIGVMGGSIGAAVAQLALAEGTLAARAAVLISPVVQLRQAVAAGERQFGVSYTWSAEAIAVADRLDFVARAGDLAGRSQPAVLLVVGEQDDPGFRDSAAQLRTALASRYADQGRAKLVVVPGMAHALADEPGTDPAPQTPHAAVVDRLATEWFQRHLVEGQ
jgi:dienelactone hydrolase